MAPTSQHVLLDRIPGQARALVRASGPDAERFLQGTLSADLGDLGHDRALPATLLTVKGKIVADAVVLRLPGGDIGLLVPEGVADEVVALLDRHVIMDEVTVARSSERAALVWPERPPEGQVFETRHPAPGWIVVDTPDRLEASLGASSEVSVEAFTRHRIETASPAWDHELAPGFFPPEVGLTYAVSYDKGCFMGQEPLARIHARGHVNRVMVRVELDVAPDADASVGLSSSERPEAGRLTSWARSDGGAIGLAIVHASLASPGVELRGEGVGAVRVTSGALGGDPGVG